MPRIRVLVTHDGEAYFVDLPEYSMIDGSFLPLTTDKVRADGISAKALIADVLALGTTVEVDVPDRIMDDAGVAISLTKIRAVYQGNPEWDIDGRLLRI